MAPSVVAAAPLPPLEPPVSYGELGFQQLRLAHVPETSAAPTPVILLTLYRPKQHNAFTGQMARELERAFAILGIDDRVRCIVMTGAGRMFCAGADLSEGTIERAHNERASEHRDGGGRVGLAIHRCRKPTIGAINGHAVGVGITMTLPMAIRVTHRAAKIAFPFVRRGIIPEAASAFFLPRLIGYGAALHLVTTGETVTADHRLLGGGGGSSGSSVGLFSEVLDEPAQVLPRALELADTVARQTSGVANAVTRDLIWRSPPSAEATHLLTSRLISDLFSGPDHAEGVRAFMQKKPHPTFTATLARDAPDAYPWWAEIDTSSPIKTSTDPAGKPKL